MTRFLQLHYLTIYPPSNPNRDDLGRPKSATYGGASRLRISSQSLKRAARISDVMQRDLAGHLGARTQRIGEVVRDALLAEGAEADRAAEIAKDIVDIFGKVDAKNNARTRQLAFISPDEKATAIDWAKKALAGEKLPGNTELKKLVLRQADGAADVAMFGRMLADDPDFNREAAVQVSHAITTHKALVEDDFYTAVDDLKKPAEDAGAGFIGEAGFGSGVFYLYACVDTGLLLDNLDGDTALAKQAIGALTEALAVSSPSGKKNSFAHQTRAGYIRAECGTMQPRSLAGAFFKPVAGDDLMADSITALADMAKRLDDAYGACFETCAVMDITAGQGTIADIRAFAEGCMGHE